VTTTAASRLHVPSGDTAGGPDRGLGAVLAEHRDAILGRWQEMVFGSYPPEAARFFRAEKDAFRNPVGSSLLRCTRTIYDGVALGRETDPVPEALESLVRLRAVQEFSASSAVGFVFWLKRAVREHLRELGVESELWAELVVLDERIDALAAAAFDLYGQCRERIYAIRVDEHRRRAASLLKQLDGRRRGEVSPVAADEEAGPRREDEG
jgi:RsbT co-antagonist protein rsbRD N-terminal domain